MPTACVVKKANMPHNKNEIQDSESLQNPPKNEQLKRKTRRLESFVEPIIVHYKPRRVTRRSIKSTLAD